MTIFAEILNIVAKFWENSICKAEIFAKLSLKYWRCRNTSLPIYLIIFTISEVCLISPCVFILKTNTKFEKFSELALSCVNEALFVWNLN